MLPLFADETIYVISPTIVDDRGTPRETFDEEAPGTPVEGCVVQPGTSVELVAGRNNVVVRYTVMAPPGTVVTEADAVRYNGELFHVDSRPAVQSSPSGLLDHVVILLIDWEG